MKQQIDVLDYTESILKGVKCGVLLTTAAEGRVNTMAISWGTLGIEWGRVIFTTFVRLGRFTREMLDKNGEFTVNIPLDGSDKSIVGKCGTCSGRAVDKIRQFNLTLVDGEKYLFQRSVNFRLRWNAVSSSSRYRTSRPCMSRK